MGSSYDFISPSADNTIKTPPTATPAACCFVIQLDSLIDQRGPKISKHHLETLDTASNRCTRSSSLARPTHSLLVLSNHPVSVNSLIHHSPWLEQSRIFPDSDSQQDFQFRTPPVRSGTLSPLRCSSATGQRETCLQLPMWSSLEVASQEPALLATS